MLKLKAKMNNVQKGGDPSLSLRMTRTALKTLFAGSAIFIIAPYLTFDYAGYLKLQKIPPVYKQLDSFFQENKNYCHKIYYPPGLGFIYFNDQNNIGASNTDTLANAIGIPYLDDGTTYSYLPTNERFFRNELVSQFYEKEDSGQFAGLMQEGGIDCVVLRLDTESKYDQASNLWQEKDPRIVKKWNQTDLLSLTRSKVGLSEDKKFGENIYIFKLETRDSRLETNNNFQNSKVEKTGQIAIQQFTSADGLPLTTYNLPLADWANNYAYYKDGWSRGRYDFWRKHLFTQLRQDFIYTDKPGSTLNGRIDEKGNYELWTRYLAGGTVRSFQLTINNQLLTINQDTGEERFVWKDLGDIQLNGKTEVEIKNISGENAIADIVLAPLD